MIEVLVGCGITATVAWCTWVTMSLSNQSKELAVIKTGNAINKDLYELLKARLT